MTRQAAVIIRALLAVVVLAVPPVARGDKPLSNDQKKEIVYRLYETYKEKDFPRVDDISPRDAMALVATQTAVFVDVRKHSEMEVSTLPGAISKKQFTGDPDRYSDKTVIAYCTISYRSGLFAREMTSSGFPVYNLRGGILAWTLEGGKVFDAEGETRRIHVYGDEWDYAPAGYETVTLGFFERLF
jgi:sodium/bile acid cotransporter 7